MMHIHVLTCLILYLKPLLGLTGPCNSNCLKCEKETIIFTSNFIGCLKPTGGGLLFAKYHMSRIARKPVSRVSDLRSTQTVLYNHRRWLGA